jgi:hypothetical protein
MKWALSRIFALVASLMAFALPNTVGARQTPSPESQPNSLLKDFLISLMNDPTRLVAFRENPDAILAGTGLSADEKKALRDGDHKAIQDLLAQGGLPKPLPPITLRPTPNPDTPPKPPPPEPTPKPSPMPPPPTPNPN